jgi:hypothetical protein
LRDDDEAVEEKSRDGEEKLIKKGNTPPTVTPRYD